MEKTKKQRNKETKLTEDKSVLSILSTEPTFITVKDNYLPYVLIRLGVGLGKTNAETRDFIRTQGVVLNGVKTFDPDATNESTNFELVVDRNKYMIILL